MPSELLIVDLKTGKVTKPNVEYPINPETFKVSPDGKFLYATDGKSIARFKIDGTNLVQEEISEEIALNKFQQQIEMSADGKLVWLLSQNIPPSQAKVDFPTTILDAMNLKIVNKVKAPRLLRHRSTPQNLPGGDHKLRELAGPASLASSISSRRDFAPICR